MYFRPSLLTGWILIDRCGKHFGSILNFLRDGSVPLPEQRKELMELYTEAKYYLVQEMVDVIDQEIKKNREPIEPICKVPLITLPREEKLLVETTTKVHACCHFSQLISSIGLTSLEFGARIHRLQWRGDCGIIRSLPSITWQCGGSIS